MLCTQCSRVIKPIVAIDIDGTLGDYHGHFQNFVAGWLGVQPVAESRPYDGTERYGTWFCRTYSTDLETFRAVKLAFRMGGLKRSMPVIQDADLITNCLRADGYEVWLVTNRPFLKVDSIDPDTRHWLQRHRITFDHLLYGPHKYERLIEQVDKDRIVAIVDDDGFQIQEAIDLGLETILIRTKYNRGVEHVNMAYSLYHLRSLTRMSLNGWNVTRREPTPEPAA